MQPKDLPKHFQPYIINHDAEMADLLSKLDTLFNSYPLLTVENGYTPLGDKGHILEHPTLPGWVIKRERDVSNEDAIHFESDSHIYRIENYAKIRAVIQKYHFTHLILPKKYLYQYKQQWFVIAQKLELKTTDRPLTGEEAYELATLCFEGRLEDMSPSNINFHKSGKIAIVDTEPVSRKIMKNFEKYWRYRFALGVQDTLVFTSSMANAERLYLLCPKEVKSVVRKVQKAYLIRQVTKILFLGLAPLIIFSGLFFFPTLYILGNLLLLIGGLHASMGFYSIYLIFKNYHEIIQESEINSLPYT